MRGKNDRQALIDSLSVQISWLQNNLLAADSLFEQLSEGEPDPTEEVELMRILDLLEAGLARTSGDRVMEEKIGEVQNEINDRRDSYLNRARAEIFQGANNEAACANLANARLLDPDNETALRLSADINCPD